MTNRWLLPPPPHLFLEIELQREHEERRIPSRAPHDNRPPPLVCQEARQTALGTLRRLNPTVDTFLLLGALRTACDRWHDLGWHIRPNYWERQLSVGDKARYWRYWCDYQAGWMVRVATVYLNDTLLVIGTLMLFPPGVPRWAVWR